MKWTICWNSEQSLINTLLVSGIILKKNNIDRSYPKKVKIYSMSDDNQQVTNKYNTLVGTSEAIRPLPSKTLPDESWNQWLAGLIDGGGSLLINKNSKRASCEITLSLKDEHALAIIKQKLGGSIKPRSGANSIRYRLHNNEGMIDLINRINGKIRHTSRLKQLGKVCSLLNVIIKYPYDQVPITKNNGWFSGFFDAVGAINYTIKDQYPQLTISVTNHLLVDVLDFRNIFNGDIRFDIGRNGYYRWSIQVKDDIYLFKAYLSKYPCKSNKKQRLFLIDKYYYLTDHKAYNSTSNMPSHKAWCIFNDEWIKRG